jgi:hypothetical protein
VSSIITFFLATDDEEAAGMPPGSLTEGPETVQLGNFDPVGSLDDEELHSGTAEELLAEIAGLAVLADQRGHGVYCWWY